MTGPEAPVCPEQARQNALLALILAGAPSGTASPPVPPVLASALRLAPATQGGLQAHWAHAQAVARRTLALAYPTVGAMVGAAALDTVADWLWRLAPPGEGDLGSWGQALPDLLTGALPPVAWWAAPTGLHPAQDLADWPWLADAARLDWARHQAARAACLPPDRAALSTLGEANPDTTRLRLQAHVHLVDSPWPLSALWAAHQRPEAQQAEAAAAALSGAPGAVRSTVVWWSGDGVAQATLDAAEGPWMHLLSNPRLSLAQALAQAPANLDLGAWLVRALQSGWLLGTAATPAA